MSLRSLAQAYLASQQKPNDCKLSQRDTPRGVPAGQMALNELKTDIYGVPASVPSGTVKKGEKAPRTVGTSGTLGTIGTSGTRNLTSLQREADRRNATEYRNGSTFRYCRCGSLAECAWPLEGRRELWRCFRCLEPMGVA